MLIVWIFYAQLLYNNYRSQRKPNILIHNSMSEGQEAQCLISNLSYGSVFIYSIYASLKHSNGQSSYDITDLNDPRAAAKIHNPLQHVSHGPLQPGNSVCIGSFPAIRDYVLRRAGMVNTEVDRNKQPDGFCLTIRIIAIYGSEKKPVGAERPFNILKEEDPDRIEPVTIDTNQLQSYKARKKIKLWRYEVEHSS